MEGFGPFTISVAALPFTLTNYVLPILLFFTPQDKGRRIPLDFTLLGPANTSLMKDQIFVDAPDPQHRGIIAVTLNNVLLAEVGTYRVRFEVGATKYDGPSFDVEMLADESATTAH